jgi:hypothetical protein
MELKVLRRGSTGPLVVLWQEFLIGEGLYKKKAHGNFDDYTYRATRRYQRSYMSLLTDGVVGNNTWCKALRDGLELLSPDEAVKGSYSTNYPPSPTNLAPVPYKSRNSKFGAIKFKESGKGDGITITNGWNKRYLTKVLIPQLETISGAPKSCKVFWNAMYIDNLVGLFQAWEKKDLLSLILSWDGSWCPRFVRGSSKYLSNHSWATAFDINAEWNGLRKQPARKGTYGTVRPLVETANEHGFWWGGHFERKDGMHFEIGEEK